LPQHAIPVALLFFNIGVELGQLLFVAAVASCAWGLRRARIRWRSWTEVLPAYAIGTIATFWVMQRVLDFTAY